MIPFVEFTIPYEKEKQKALVRVGDIHMIRQALPDTAAYAMGARSVVILLDDKHWPATETWDVLWNRLVQASRSP